MRGRTHLLPIFNLLELARRPLGLRRLRRLVSCACCTGRRGRTFASGTCGGEDVVELRVERFPILVAFASAGEPAFCGPAFVLWTSPYDASVASARARGVIDIVEVLGSLRRRRSPCGLPIVSHACPRPENARRAQRFSRSSLVPRENLEKNPFQRENLEKTRFRGKNPFLGENFGKPLSTLYGELRSVAFSSLDVLELGDILDLSGICSIFFTPAQPGTHESALR